MTEIPEVESREEMVERIQQEMIDAYARRIAKKLGQTVVRQLLYGVQPGEVSLVGEHVGLRKLADKPS